MSNGKQILFSNKLKALRGQVFLGLLTIVKLACTAPHSRRFYRQLLRRLVKKTGLFDPEYYLSANGDVAQQSKSVLLHYVAYGDKEGRMPLPVFEPVYYRQHCQSKLKSVNTLLHYVYVGRYLKISPSPWIDLEYYLAKNKDIARSGIDPLRHYLLYGGLEGRSPSPHFDSAHYLREYSDVRIARTNPLIHYIRFGRLEGRQSSPVDTKTARPPEYAESLMSARLPLEPDWQAMNPHSEVAQATVDVIVPVYKGRAETLRCLYSLLTSSSKIVFEVVVINDASPDEDLVADLVALSDKGYITLLQNAQNLGFVRTINRGMKQHKCRDVVLLNSDTEVYGDWLDRLHRVAKSREAIGTVTPLSNNATICSYPRFLYDNPYPLEIDYAELDQLTAKINTGFYVEAPTGVGFCMYIKRSCLDEVGLFDEKAFGKGYGEENDFCQRAIANGWCNVIATEVFVRHWGSASFQGEKENRVQKALKVLARRHPEYSRDVQHFIAQDPLALARKRLDQARLHRLVRKENVLIVSHDRGGGSERRMMEDVDRLTNLGKGVFFLRPQQGAPGYVVLKHPVVKLLSNLSPIQFADTEKLTNLLKDLAISEIHTHGLVDFSMQAPEHLTCIVKQLDLYLEVNIHDYKVICPRINLVDDQGYYCGENSVAHCNSCLKSFGSDFGVRSIEAWRAIHHQALLSADRVLVPDIDVTQRLKRYYPDVNIEVSPHEEIDHASLPTRRQVLHESEPIRIVVIGAIGKMKGFDVLLACARDAQERKLSLEFFLMGYSMNDPLLREAGVCISGRYLEKDALATLASLEPHVAWLPSVWPETYSYTLSIALLAGHPVVAFDIGAIASRLRAITRHNHLIPLEFAKSPKRVNDYFLKFQ